MTTFEYICTVFFKHPNWEGLFVWMYIIEHSSVFIPPQIWIRNTILFIVTDSLFRVVSIMTDSRSVTPTSSPGLSKVLHSQINKWTIDIIFNILFYCCNISGSDLSTRVKAENNIEHQRVHHSTHWPQLLKHERYWNLLFMMLPLLEI